MEAEKMEAGRELDALVAERVMGLRDTYWRGVRQEYARDLSGDIVPVLCYSTDIAAAWSVVEKMTERGTDLVLQHREEGGWRAYFRARPAESNRNPLKVADTPALAICRAALAALGVIDA